jgi:hypothetical protein
MAQWTLDLFSVCVCVWVRTWPLLPQLNLPNPRRCVSRACAYNTRAVITRFALQGYLKRLCVCVCVCVCVCDVCVWCVWVCVCVCVCVPGRSVGWGGALDGGGGRGGLTEQRSWVSGRPAGVPTCLLRL